MSERTRSSRSKTRTDTLSSGTTEPTVEDRWSNHINYHQLVASSCISIVQLWWHPYVHDLRSFIPFLFLYNLFSVIISYPMFYLELAIGVVTKKSVMKCWDIEPVARGASVTMLIVCMYTILCLGLVSSYCLALLVHSFHSFLPWLHCAADAKQACVARHRPMSEDSDLPPQSFFFNLVLNLKREGLVGGLGSIVWELSVYYVICWVLIYFIAIKRIYSYSKIVLFKDVLAFFTLICLAIGVTRLEGSGKMFDEADWTVLLDGPGVESGGWYNVAMCPEKHKIWREAIEYALLQMSIGQGTTMMLGSYCPIPKHNLRTTAMITFMVSKTTTMVSALVLGGVHGALKHDYDNLNVTNIVGGSSASLVLWSDTVARIPGSQFWSAVVFFSLFVLALATVALMVQTIMSAFTGKSVRKVRFGFLILLCFLCCLIGILTLCAQGGLFILNFLMVWPVTRLRLPLAAMTGIVITFLHGQKTFCEDVFFAVGEYPCLFYRLSWAVSPWFLIIMFVTSFFGSVSWRAIIGWLLVHASLLPIAIIAIVYFIFKCRVRNIVAETK